MGLEVLRDTPDCIVRYKHAIVRWPFLFFSVPKKLAHGWSKTKRRHPEVPEAKLETVAAKPSPKQQAIQLDEDHTHTSMIDFSKNMIYNSHTFLSNIYKGPDAPKCNCKHAGNYNVMSQVRSISISQITNKRILQNQPSFGIKFLYRFSMLII